jgi:type I restriction enzyme, S subunit
MRKQYEEYKESGIEWLGEVPAHWEVKKLKRICEFKYGDSLKSETRSDEGEFHVYGSNGIVGKHDIAITNAPCIVVGRKGSYGKINFSEYPCFPIDTTYFIDDTSTSYNIRYLYYLLQTLGLDEFSRDSAVPGLSREEAYNKICAFAPKTEHEAIADYLDYKTGQLDKLITQKEELMDLLQRQRQAIINEAVTQGLNPNAPRKDSGIEWLGEIPEHWEVSKLKYLTTKIGSGVTPLGGSETYLDEGIPLLRSQNIYPDGLRLKDVAFISEEVHNSMSNSKVEAGDVLLNITGASIGRCFYYEGQSGEANVNQHVCIIRPNERLDNKFLQLILSSDIGQHQIMLSQNGASREGLTFAQLRNFIIPLPALEEQRNILENAHSNLEKIKNAKAALNTQIKKLKSYRQSIINEVVTGKVDVRDVVLSEV